jgi:hypothetical protein
MDGDDSSYSRDPNVCLFCSHSKTTHAKCKALVEKHKQHLHKEVKKLSRYVNLPTLNLEWRNCMLSKVDPKIRSRLKNSSHYKIAALHFLSCCIDPDKETHILKKFVSSDEIKSLQRFEHDLVGRYRTTRRNYVNVTDRPHGLKTDHIWYSIPEFSVDQVDFRYSALDGMYSGVQEMAKAERKRKADENKIAKNLLEAEIGETNKISRALAKSNVPGLDNLFFTVMMRKDEVASKLAMQVESLAERVNELEDQNASLTAELHEMTKKLAAAHDCTLSAIINTGGVCASNMINERYHSQYPLACKTIFGFKSFKDMTCRLKCFFPDELIDPETNDLPRSMLGSERRKKYLLNYESCLITIMRMHRRATLDYLSLVWKKSRFVISRAIQIWAPKLGQKGLECSILDVLPAFLAHAMPQKFKDNNYDKVGYLVDGKVFMVEECRKFSNIKRLCWNSKTKSAGVLMLDYTIPMGIGVYHSPGMCGRCTEPSLVRMCCDQPSTINFGATATARVDHNKKFDKETDTRPMYDFNDE